MTILTTTIRGSIKVLAKTTKYGVTAFTFANRTQAANRSAEVNAAGVLAEVVQFGRPFYVRVNGLL